MEGHRAVRKCEVRPFKAEYWKGYNEGCILDCSEGGSTTELLRPCHEFKSLYNAESNNDDNEFARLEDIKRKFATETVKFATACINSRQNGTIHIGIADEVLRESQAGTNEPKEIVGLELTEDDKGWLKEKLEGVINSCFENNDKVWVAKCILHPVFIPVIPSGAAVPSRYVIEVDVNPESSVTDGKPLIGITLNKLVADSKGASKEPFYYMRIMSSSKSLNKGEIARYANELRGLDQARKEKEMEAKDSVKAVVKGMPAALTDELVQKLLQSPQIRTDLLQSVRIDEVMVACLSDYISPSDKDELLNVFLTSQKKVERLLTIIENNGMNAFLAFTNALFRYKQIRMLELLIRGLQDLGTDTSLEEGLPKI